MHLAFQICDGISIFYQLNETKGGWNSHARKMLAIQRDTATGDRSLNREPAFLFITVYSYSSPVNKTTMHICRIKAHVYAGFATFPMRSCAVRLSALPQRQIARSHPRSAGIRRHNKYATRYSSAPAPRTAARYDASGALKRGFSLRIKRNASSILPMSGTMNGNTHQVSTAASVTGPVVRR